MMLQSIRRTVLLTILGAVFALGACNKTDPAKAPATTAQSTSGNETVDPVQAKGGHGGSGQLVLSAEEIERSGIRVEALKAQSFVDQIILTATIRANQDRIAHVAPRVSARILKVSANLGDQVQNGQMLAQLDSIELGEAHSGYRQAQSQFTLAAADFERAQKLKVDDIIPEKDFLRARSEYEKAKAGLRAADEKLSLLDAAHREPEQGSGAIFPLNAPFSGTVIEKDAVLGELAQPDKSIFTVADLSTLWIEANLFEKDLTRVEVGAAATVTVSAYPGEAFNGHLTYISSAVDKESRTVPARVEVPNSDGRLKLEMFATTSINTAATALALTVPTGSVLLVNGLSTVFVQARGGFEPRSVEVGDMVGGRVIVNSGVKEGERIVVAGAYALKARMLKSQIGDE